MKDTHQVKGSQTCTIIKYHHGLAFPAELPAGAEMFEYQQIKLGKRLTEIISDFILQPDDTSYDLKQVKYHTYQRDKVLTNN